jgi:hypothetical protein
MKTVLRTFTAVVAGLAVGFALVVAVEFFSAVVHPVPEDFGGTMEEMCLHVENYPGWVLAVAVGMWGAAALISTWTALKLGNLYSFAIVVLLLVAALVLNISMLPYPIWFKIATLIVIPAAIVLARRLAVRHQSGIAEAN